jgi:tRNA(fMet)-specific endonuclease VapC
MFLLDTDICSYLMKRSHPPLISRVSSFAPGELKISAVTAYELEYGVRRRGPEAKALLRTLEAFCANVEILPWSLEAARSAAAVRCELEASGAPIGAYDLLIAGHARSLGMTLVTHNVRELGRVRGLAVADWAA